MIFKSLIYGKKIAANCGANVVDSRFQKRQYLSPTRASCATIFIGVSGRLNVYNGTLSIKKQLLLTGFFQFLQKRFLPISFQKILLPRWHHRRTVPGQR